MPQQSVLYGQFFFLIYATNIFHPFYLFLLSGHHEVAVGIFEIPIKEIKFGINLVCFSGKNLCGS